MDAAKSLGLDVPRDVSVVGFDNIPESALANPPLTTVSQPLQQMGARAIEMLVGLIEGHPPESTHVRLPTQLVVRSTTRRL
jgi:LacI family transcriptional regulator